MERIEDTLRAPDGVMLTFYSWLPADAPRAHLTIVHGYAEYLGRYEHLAEFFTGNGYAVHGIDLRGHGHSGGHRSYVDRFELYLKDLTLTLDRVRAQAGKAPVFLFGHSMGGGIVALYGITRQPKVRGVILSAAALRVNKDIAPLLQKLSTTLSPLIPKVRTVRLDVTAISRDPEVVRLYREDPLIDNGPVYVRTGAEVLKATRRIQANMEAFRLPVLLMHGDADRINDIEGSEEFYRRAGSEDKTLRRFEGLYHELVNEPEKEQVITEMLRWMEQRLE
jgi:acylglycerol lipase